MLLAIFVTATAVAGFAWSRARGLRLPTGSRALERGSGVLLVVIAVFVAVGLHLPTFVDALRDRPTGTAYLGAPTLFWVVKFYDLAIVVPAALTVGVGLLRRRPWARLPAYGILGGYVLVGCSVAGMAWSMLLADDPDASVGQALTISLVVAAALVFAYVLYRPLVRPAGGPPSANPRDRHERSRSLPVAHGH